jgi:ADP-ribose pyrophosphatase
MQWPASPAPWWARLERAVDEPRILARRVEYRSPWLEVVAKDVDLGPPRGVERFDAVATTEYAAVLAITPSGRIPLVRQFRPAVESRLLELPSGGVDPGESPEEATRRELLEETGCRAEELELLGWLHTDPGRMETRQWCYFAPGATRVADGGGVGGESLELSFVSVPELLRLVAEGGIRTGLHLALIAIALARGRLS